MAPKKSRRQNTFVPVEFVNAPLTAEEKKAFKAWYKGEPDKVFTGLINLIPHGYKQSVSWSDDQQCFTASLTCRDEENPNFNMCLTGRSNDYWEAHAIVFYKHEFLSEGGIWAFDTQSSSWG